MSSKPPRIVTLGAIALSLALVLPWARGADPDLAGEWLLEGDEDGEPVRTTLLVRADGADLVATRFAVRTRTGATSVHVGWGRAKGSALEVELARTLPSGERSPVTATYELGPEGRCEGRLAAPPAWKKGHESGTRLVPREGDDALTAGPYLLDARATSAVVAWRTAGHSSGTVEWGETPALGQVAGDPAARSRRHAVRVEGLAPGRTYFYRLASGDRPLSGLAWLTTAAPRGTKRFTFAAIGDSGTGGREQLDLARHLARESADFVVHLGDVTYPHEKGGWDEKFFSPYSGLLRTRPIYPVVGNHDADEFEKYEHAFGVPGPDGVRARRHYDFSWGDAKLVAVDTGSEDWTPGPQADWLRTQLAPHAGWLVFLTHVPLVTTRPKDGCPAVERALLPLVESARVELVLAGHKHRYERSRPLPGSDRSWKGTTHVTTGGGGAKLSRIDPRASAFARAESVHHYVVFVVEPGRIVGRAVRVDGTVLDEFTVTKD